MFEPCEQGLDAVKWCTLITDRSGDGPSKYHRLQMNTKAELSTPTSSAKCIFYWFFFQPRWCTYRKYLSYIHVCLLWFHILCFRLLLVCTFTFALTVIHESLVRSIGLSWSGVECSVCDPSSGTGVKCFSVTINTNLPKSANWCMYCDRRVVIPQL